MFEPCNRIFGLLGALALIGCVDAPVDPRPVDGQPDEIRDVVYRGRVVAAERHRDIWLIEGDIEIVPEAFVSELEEGHGMTRQEVVILGDRYQWPGFEDSAGRWRYVIPFRFTGPMVDVNGDGTADDFTQAQQDRIVAAMDDWSDAVPSLLFRPAEDDDDDLIQFQLDTRCSSPVGRQRGAQTIRLTANCAATFSIHHEIGHSLGLYHQHTRKDRDAFVVIQWQNIQGCPSDADDPSDCGNDACDDDPADCGCTQSQVDNNRCDRSGNFVSDDERSNVGAYDFDSVMHYRASSFPKPGAGDTITVPTGETIGQRDHLAASDNLAVAVMYPATRSAAVVFRDTGDQTLCRLGGRVDDIATHFTGELASGYRILDDTGAIDTDGLPQGTYEVDCVARSGFWDFTYDYPNPSWDTSATWLLSEEYPQHGQVAVLDPGLIPIMY